MHKSLAIHDAYKRGDLEALKTLLGNPPDFPNCQGPPGMGEIILEYAIYHSPLFFIRELLAVVCVKALHAPARTGSEISSGTADPMSPLASRAPAARLPSAFD